MGAGFTGVLLVIIICIIYIFATATARTHIFTAFWTTHQLLYALYVIILLHGSVRLVQDPYFPYYFCVPAILFGFDKLVSVSRKKRKLNVVHAELLPSGRKNTCELKQGNDEYDDDDDDDDVQRFNVRKQNE